MRAREIRLKKLMSTKLQEIHYQRLSVSEKAIKPKEEAENDRE